MTHLLRSGHQQPPAQDTLMAVIFALLALLLHDAEMQRALWLRWPCLAVGSVRLGAVAADRRSEVVFFFFSLWGGGGGETRGES